MQEMAALFRLEAQSNGQIKVVRTAGELTEALAGGVIAAVLHFEGAEAIDPELDVPGSFLPGRAEIAGDCLEPPQCFRPRRPIPFSPFAGHGAGPERGGAEIGQGVQSARYYD